MKTVTDAGDAAGTPTIFVKNQLVIAVPKGNPKGITGLADLTRPGRQGGALRRAGAVRRGGRRRRSTPPASRSPRSPWSRTSRRALTKVKLGEVDAALVYRTDAKAAARRRRRHRVPRVGRRGQRLPDRRRCKDAPNPAGARGLRRVRALGAGPGGAHRRRLPAALSRAHAQPPTARAGRGCRSPCWCPPGSGCLPRAAAGRAAGPGALVDAAAAARPSRACSTALRLSLRDRHPGHRCSAWCSACRWPGCWPGPSSPAGGWCARWSPCRWCCRRWSAAWRCCWSSAGAGCSAAGSTRRSGSRLPFTTAGRGASPRRSWRCRSW